MSLSEVAMLLLLLVCLVTSGSGSVIYNPRKVTPESTSIACEDSVVKLDCEQKNGIIRITRANYGRLTLTLCSNHRTTEGSSVSCLVPDSKRIVAERCDGHPKCEIMASNDVFGDPCVNTSKYLKVYYTCEPIVYTLPPLTTTKIPTTATEVTVTINNPPQIQVCDAIYFEDRNWPYTNVGEVASMSCIPPKVGRITWRCTGNGWEGERPDDSNCHTPVTAEESTKEVTVPPEEKCRLPPNVDVEAISPEDVEGFKFGDTLTSRHEYVGWKSLRVNATIEIEFKTTSSGGIMLYATDRRKTDFISLIMKDGHLVLSFNSGSGALNLKTDQKYNDGKWHTVEFGRNKKTGKISVDGGAAKEGTSPGPTLSLNLRKPFFVGGINPDLSSNDKVKKHLQGVLGSFEGCMRNMKQNYESFGQPSAIQKVSSCVANLERGTFFNDQGCYITLYAFKKEKITPDIVCFLNRNEMLQLGLHPQEMTKLRNFCINYGTKQPTRQISGCGASKFSIPKDILRNFIEDGFSISNIASLLSVSEKTIYRRMQEYNLKKQVYTDIDDREITKIVKDLIEEFPSCGEIMLGHILQQKNIKIERAKLRLILHEHDKDGIMARRSGRLQRRTYQSQGPNHIWHIDSNHKLVRWNFIVSGGIDGFSRMIVFLKCEDNNKADTVFKCFMEGVKDFGVPLRVRTDKGMENSKIADFMIEKRGSSSMLLGKSVHNQRIERLWRDVFNGVLGYYYRLFYFMEEEEILDPLNEIHLLALHYIYLPKINEKLKLWSNAWATHKLRTVKASPLCLWTAGNFNNPVGDDVSDSVDNLLEHGLNELEENPRPIFEGLSLLNPLCLEELERRCPATWTSINHGIDKYQICVEVLKSFNF